MTIKSVIREEIELANEIKMDPSPRKKRRKKASAKASPKRVHPSKEPL